ncbi:helix-turn-helix domain-containing protein [Streptomyces sp. CS62]|uniref:helix-turn-helix domain-containing protein n=1 Tax=Streptomyces sp. CS62 TaxID=3119268 RepID=UPI002F93139B
MKGPDRFLHPLPCPLRIRHGGGRRSSTWRAGRSEAAARRLFERSALVTATLLLVRRSARRGPETRRTPRRPARGPRTAPDRPAALGFIGGLDGDRGGVAAYGDRVLGPVLACDTERDTERGRTLHAYYDQGASLARAEDALHVHADTVVQRTDRVAQLLGPD